MTQFESGQKVPDIEPWPRVAQTLLRKFLEKVSLDTFLSLDRKVSLDTFSGKRPSPLGVDLESS